MKISRDWLQSFFENPLPETVAIADALTFHAFEIDGIENDVLDVKITANRGHDCLSHRGIAKELSAILKVPMKSDALREPAPLEPKTADIAVSIQSTDLCNRYIAGYIRGVRVAPSPEWLKGALGSIGQKSINNVVDATNYVMFHLGQPLHAFDASQLQNKNGFAIDVRSANTGEKMIALDDKEYELTENMLVIGDAHSGKAIGIAGVKGGKPASITESTTDIIIESANFNGVSVRKTAAALKLRTDASSRFEQVISSELAAYGMRAVVELIQQLAGGEVAGFVDAYPAEQETKSVSVSLSKINAVLGTALTETDIADVLKRLDLAFVQEGDSFTVTPPFERLDLIIPEDLIEEVGRIIGYDAVPSVELDALPDTPVVNPNFYAAEQKREELMASGYSEVVTSVFAEKGERVIANKVDGVRPYLRTTLVDGLTDAYQRNIRNRELLGLKEVRLFEIGAVWREDGEQVYIGTADVGGVKESLLVPMDSVLYADLSFSTTERYAPFSKYPFIVRDIALWVPSDTTSEQVIEVIRAHAGDLLVRSEKFDEFKKGERTSHAFHLVFQSPDRTLTDGDANERMESVYAAVKANDWEVR